MSRYFAMLVVANCNNESVKGDVEILYFKTVWKQNEYYLNNESCL